MFDLVVIGVRMKVRILSSVFFTSESSDPVVETCLPLTFR